VRVALLGSGSRNTIAKKRNQEQEGRKGKDFVRNFFFFFTPTVLKPCSMWPMSCGQLHVPVLRFLRTIIARLALDDSELCIYSTEQKHSSRNYPKDYNRVGAEYITFCGISAGWAQPSPCAAQRRARRAAAEEGVQGGGWPRPSAFLRFESARRWG
jgi:hypothetical protein